VSEVAHTRLRYCLHGPGIEISCQVPPLIDAINHALGELAVPSLVGKTSIIHGSIGHFDQRQVRMHLSSTARRLSTENDLLELYEEDERFWRLDDHWGLCEINVLRGHFRSWILPVTHSDEGKIVEEAVMWPIAQLLRQRGICLIPAATLARDDWGVLVLSTFNIEPELTAMVHAGFRVVGQSWSALREQGRRIVMLPMPGSVERDGKPVDLTRESPGSSCETANCDAVIVLSPGRRPLTNFRAISPANALGRVRHAWPIVELHPLRRPGQMPARLAHRCRVFEMQLSRNPRELLGMLETARYQRPQTPAIPVVATRVA
jgi:hypothetical protein